MALFSAADVCLVFFLFFEHCHEHGFFVLLAQPWRVKIFCLQCRRYCEPQIAATMQLLFSPLSTNSELELTNNKELGSRGGRELFVTQNAVDARRGRSVHLSNFREQQGSSFTAASEVMLYSTSCKRRREMGTD